MFFDRDIKGDRLPPRTLCLTYDDGPGVTEGTGDDPGPHTPELGHFLADRAIRATFFALGRHVEAHPEVVGRLRAWGHLVGNHTYSHPGLVNFALAGGDVAAEIGQTDQVIEHCGAGRATFFRAPYGNWREKQSPDSPQDKPTSVVAEIANGCAALADHVGPVNWDVNAADYDFWRRGGDAADCARAYLAKIEQVGRGIVLMHDSSEDAALRAHNRTFETTRRLVTALVPRGFRFVRLDAIPQVRSARRVSEQVFLRTAGGKVLACRDDDGIIARNPGEGDGAVFGIVRLRAGQIALRAPHGLYVSASRHGVTARADTLGRRETWDVERASDGFLLRAYDGNYLAWAGDGAANGTAALAARPDADVFQARRRFDSPPHSRPPSS